MSSRSVKVLIFSTVYKEKDKPFVEELFICLEQNNIAFAVVDVFGRELMDGGVLNRDVELIPVSTILAPQDFDYVISLGGDGTILRATTMVRSSDIPIMGINLGRLGFLSNIEKTNIAEAVSHLKLGRFVLDERTLLGLESNIPTFVDAPFALNDVTIHKRDTSSMITIHAYVDDVFLNSYWADGIIVSTPTGSTGYSLSCGGPIIYPGSGNIVVTPVAPHNLNVRPMVLPDTRRLTLEVEGRSENFLCTLDSRYETISSDHKITLSRCNYTIKFVLPEEVNFLRTIRHKLMWGLDKRN